MKINPQVKPMLFSGDLVKSLLAGNKTQTRRLVPEWQKPKPLPADVDIDQGFMSVVQRDPKYGFGLFGETEEECMEKYESQGHSPFGDAGDFIYVRETAEYVSDSFDGMTISYVSPNTFSGKCHRDIGTSSTDVPEDKLDAYFRIVDKSKNKEIRIPSIHMPRWASRLTLKITSVRVERIQDITNEDAILEGCNPLDERYAVVDEFKPLWDSVYPKSWDRNDWVWVIDFEVIHKNVDQYLKTA